LTKAGATSTADGFFSHNAEEDALSKNEFAGIGFSQDYRDWYGGKVHFRAQLRDLGSEEAPKYKVVLDRPELGTSCRFSRRFGSQSILRIKIPKDTLNRPDNKLVQFFLRPFVLSGKVFRAFYARSNHVFLYKTYETFNGNNVLPTRTTQLNSDLLEFINWHNPLELNTRQASFSPLSCLSYC
jgi:RNA-dependent RNA polymerase